MSPTPEIVRITHPEHGPVFEFGRPVTQDEASRALFGNDGPPTGVTVRPGGSPDEWQVQGLNAGNVGELTGNLPAIVASSTEVVPRDEHDAERAARESANDAAMNEPLPGLGETAKQIFDTYGPGHHEVNGNFVWIGIKDGEKTIQWHPRTDNETFNKDIDWYLDHGLSLSGAIHKFDQQWNEITAQILRAFGGTLASAGGAGVPVKPPFGMTQALTLGVDAIKTIKTPGDGAYDAVPMPSEDRARQHDEGDAGPEQTERAAPEAEEEQECRPEAEPEECRLEPEASAAPEAEPASYPAGGGEDLGVNLGLGPGVTPDDFTPAAFSSDSHTGLLGHGDDSGAGLFDDAGPSISTIEPDGAAFGDPGLPSAVSGADQSLFADPGAGLEGGSPGPGGGLQGGVFGDPGAGYDGAVPAPGGFGFGDPGAGYDGAVPAPGGFGFGDPGAGHDGAVPAPGGFGFGDPGAGYDGGLLAPGGGAFGDPGAGHDAGICGPAGGWADPGGQSAIGPGPGTGAFAGDPGQAFGTGSVGGAADGGSGAM